MILFPYLLPCVAFSLLLISWMLVDTNRSTYLGINNDGVPLFLVLYFWCTVIAQLVIGIPLSFLLAWIPTPLWRSLIAILAVALVLIPLYSHLKEYTALHLVVAGSAAIGVWMSTHSFHPDKVREEAEQAAT